MAVTGETLFRFMTLSRLPPLITTSLEDIHGQDNDGEISFVAIIVSLYGFKKKKLKPLHDRVCVNESIQNRVVLIFSFIKWIFNLNL